MTSTDRIKLFLSYAMKDDGNTPDDPQKSLMRRLHTDLTANGFDVWWDHVSMPSRSVPMSKEIEDALRDCDRFVLIVGEHLRESVWVREEIAFAERECKPITMILRSGSLEHFPDGMSDTRALDFRPPREYEPTFEALVARLKQDAPLGAPIGVKLLPDFVLERPQPLNAARTAICSSAINPTVISAPPRPMAVSGYGGVGKSTLAATLAHDCTVRRTFKDGIIWLTIGQTPVIPQLQATIGANVFHDSWDNYQNADDGRAALSRVLREKAALIVLDDVWDHQIVRHFPVEGTACRLLITTRDRALASKIEGENVPLDWLTPDEGAALLAGKGAGDPLYRQIAEALNGHTLAIVLAGKRITKRGREYAITVMEGLKNERDPFANFNVDPNDKDLNLSRSLDQSLTMLDDDERRRFRALGVLPIESTFDLPMSAALWGDASADDADRPLEVLIDAGLVDTSGDEQYRQHRLLRAYARALLTGAGELETTFARYADFVIEQAEQFIALPIEQWSQLDALLAHVNEVGERLTDQWEQNTSARSANPFNRFKQFILNRPQPNDTTKLVKRCGEFAYNVKELVARRPQMIDTPYGHERLGLRWLEMGLVISQKTGNQEREALFCNDIGVQRSALGEWRMALDFYERALFLHRRVDDQGNEATTLNNIGLVWANLGEYRKALAYYERALLLCRAVSDRGGEATALTNIGTVWNALGELRKALEYHEQAQLLYQELGDRSGEATAFTSMGAVWGYLGEKRRALEYLKQALSLRRAVGDQSGEAVTLNNIAVIWNGLGEPRKALEYHEQALPLRRAVGDRGGEAATLNNIGYLYLQEGDLEKSLAIWQQTTQIVHEMGMVAEEALLLLNIATVYEQMGKLNEARQSAEAGKAILVHYDLPQDVGGRPIADYDAFLARLHGQPQTPPRRGLLSHLGNFLRGKRG